MDDGVLLGKIKGSMIGHTIGDRLGWPYEVMKPGEFKVARDGQGHMTYTDKPDHKFPEMRVLKPGAASDDTQHANAIARSLIRRKKFDPFDFAGELIDELEGSQSGWGTTSRVAVEKMSLFFKSRGREGHNPLLPFPSSGKKGVGTGNGVSMKAHVVPLFYWTQKTQLSSKQKIVPITLRMGLMTHADSRASVAACALAKSVLLLLRNPITEYDKRQSYSFLQELLSITRWSEELIMDPDRAIQYSIFVSDSDMIDDLFSDRIEKLLGNFEVIEDRVALREFVGTSCFALESTLFAIATFLRYPLDFEAGMYEVITAGGDVDTNAAMYGALAGVNGGLEIIPEVWRNHEAVRKDIRATENLAIELFNAARSSR